MRDGSIGRKDFTRVVTGGMISVDKWGGGGVVILRTGRMVVKISVRMHDGSSALKLLNIPETRGFIITPLFS